MQKLKTKIHFGAGLLLISLSLSYVGLGAARAIAASVSQGYHTNETLTVGTIVSLTKTGGNEVQTATQDNESLLLGIAVNSGNTIVDLQPQGSDVRVAVSGETPVLVSDINGDIKAGDKLIISQIAGVAAKEYSTSSAKKYIGVASEAFSASSSSAKEIKLKQPDGSTKTVHAGLIKVKILLTDRQGSNKTNPLIAFVENIIGRPVGTPQLIGSVVVFITAFTFTGLLLNGSIRGAFISLGRNPLSKPAIVSNMVRVSALALVVLIAGVAVAYAILLV